MDFEVHYDTIEDLKQNRVTKLPIQQTLYDTLPSGDAATLFAGFGIWCEAGLLDHHQRDLLNAKFPEIKTFTVESLLRAAWNHDG